MTKLAVYLSNCFQKYDRTTMYYSNTCSSIKEVIYIKPISVILREITFSGWRLISIPIPTMKLCNCQCFVQDVAIEISQILMLGTDWDDLNIYILTVLN